MNGRRALALTLALTATAYGCFSTASTIGSRLPRTPRFLDEWSHYERLQPSKAMAVAGDPATIYVSGYAFGYANDTTAVEGAIAACEARRIDRRITAPCETYAVGNQRVAEAVFPSISRR
jgi:hypothetical protein